RIAMPNALAEHVDKETGELWIERLAPQCAEVLHCLAALAFVKIAPRVFLSGWHGDTVILAGDSDDARAHRNGFTFEVVGIAPAAVGFVVGADNFADLDETLVMGDDLLAVFRMAAEKRLFLIGQFVN